MADGNITYIQDSDDQTSVTVANGSADIEYITASADLNEKLRITEVIENTIIIGDF